MKVTLFHIGGYKGDTTKYLKEICDRNNLEFVSHVFEPSVQWFSYLVKEFANTNFVNLYNVGVSNTENAGKLYHTPNEDGFTLHSTKWNVKNLNDFETVNCIVFSKWYKENITKTENDYFVMQCDINGGEYELFEDLIDSGICKEIDLYCGKIFGNLAKLTNKTKEEQEKFKLLLLEYGINPIELVLTTLYNLEKIEDCILRAANMQKDQIKKEDLFSQLKTQPKDGHVEDPIIETVKEIIAPSKRPTRGKRSKTK